MLLTYLLAIFIILATIFLAKFLKERQRLEDISKHFNCSPRNWLFGHSLYFLGNPADIFKRIVAMVVDNRPNMILWGVGNYIEFFITDPKDVDTILTGKVRTKKSVGYDFMAEWLGSGLLTSHGQPWFNMRKILTPAFHFKILESFIDVFNEQSKVLIEILRDRASNNDEINVYEHVTQCALDNICETAMGVQISAQRHPNQEYTVAVSMMNEILFQRMFGLLNQFPLIFNFTPTAAKQRRVVKTLHSFTEEVIRQRKVKLQDGPETPVDEEWADLGRKQRRSFLDLLLQVQRNDPAQLSDVEIRQEVDTFMFAGHDTTTAAVTFTIYELAMNPEVQAKVLDEQVSLLGTDCSRMPDFNDLQQMKYLDMVVKEVLRLHPPVPFIGRRLLEPLEMNGTIVPENVDVAIPIYVIHRNPKLFKNPDTFDPERFADGLSERGSFDYLPFSAGNRNCIGQRYALLEVKSIISAIVRSFIIHATESTRNATFYVDLVLRVEGGLRVRLEERN